ncbi:hypothetical protein QBC39DRAFT_302939 [Podospora conica]|nr:hypothetical protein QBC39DRAFT_302939 [Schizothecium conicum]
MPLGVHTLYDVSPDIACHDHGVLVDVVAVHDIHGDSIDSWTDPQTGANWLRDFLPEHIRVARVLTYGYDSTASALFANDAPDTIRGMAESLVQELRANRQFSQALRRPIVFICHGFGGVLVKKSLLYSSTRTATKVVHLLDMYISTFAIIFLGTPHGQTNKANWLELEAMSNGQRRPLSLISSRTKYTDKQDAQLPSYVDGEFSPLLKQFHMFFFWEELPTAFGSRSSFLVDHKSAAPMLDNIETAGIHADHANMARFSSKESSDFRTIIAALMTYCEKAPAIICRRWKQADTILQELRMGEVQEIGGFGFDVRLERPFRSSDMHPQKQPRVQHFYVPEEVNPTYVGREDLLQDLRSAFFGEKKSSCSAGLKSFVVFGMGGSGKTSLGSKFAIENKHEYTAVFTIRAASQETIRESYCRIGQIGGLHPTEDSGRHTLSQQVEPWLLIIDNADDRSLNIRNLFPHGGGAHVLVTTRIRDLRGEGTLGSMELKGLRETEALQLLLLKAEVPRPWDKHTITAALRIIKALGCLALALIHAGTCVYRGVCKIDEYLEIHESAKPRATKMSKLNNAVEVVYSTFDISLGVLLKDARVASRDAAELLKIMAFFHFELIPLEMFSRAVTNQEKALNLATTASWQSRLLSRIRSRLEPPVLVPGFLKGERGHLDKYRINWAIAELQSLSLIRVDDKYISLHPLIHAWARDRLSAQQRHVWSTMALNTLVCAIQLPPASTSEADGDFHRDIITHLRSCLAEVCGNPVSEPTQTMGSLLRLQPTLLLLIGRQALMHAKCGYVFAERGSFNEAAVHLEITRGLLSRVLGDDHEKTTTAALGLAGVYWGLGRLEEAIALQRSVVDNRTRVLGPMNKGTLVAMDQLGRSYWLFGQYIEALDLQQTTSERMKKTLGDKDLLTLAALDNLGVTLAAWYRYQESLELHQQVLAARTELLGPTHLDTITTKANLGTVLLELGRHEECKTSMTEVCLQRQKQLGKEHPWTLLAMCYLIRVNIQLGLLDEAEKMAEWGTQAAIRSLNEKHLGVFMGQGCLAQIYAATGREKEAEVLTRQIIKGMEESESRGVAHPDCIFALWRLARLVARMGCRDEAMRICECALERAEMRISRKHPLAKDIEILLGALRDPGHDLDGLILNIGPKVGKGACRKEES